MRELAMRAIDITPGLKQLKDRGHLLGAQTVHRLPARAQIIQIAGVAAGAPAPRPPLL